MFKIVMQKIASPQDLQAELRRLLAYCQGPGLPSRVRLAAELRGLADRVAGLPTDKIAKDAKTALDALDRAQGGAVEAATAKAKKALTKLTKAVEASLKKAEANLAEAKEDLKQYPHTKDRVESHERSVAKTKKALEAAKRAGSDHSSVRQALAVVYQWARDYGRRH